MEQLAQPAALALYLARALGEEQPAPQAQLEMIAARLGAERCLRLLEQTHGVQEKGGLLCPDGSRSRTLGGIFFWLVRARRTAWSGGTRRRAMPRSWRPWPPTPGRRPR